MAASNNRPNSIFWSSSVRCGPTHCAAIFTRSIIYWHCRVGQCSGESPPIGQCQLVLFRLLPESCWWLPAVFSVMYPFKSFELSEQISLIRRNKHTSYTYDKRSRSLSFAVPDFHQSRRKTLGGSARRIPSAFRSVALASRLDLELASRRFRTLS
jgi:hypothetical protein